MIQVILNPYANRWGAQTKQVAIEAALSRAKLQFDLTKTAQPGEGTAVARQAVQSGKYTAIVAAGGDGTINEVINGLVQATPEGPTLPFGIFPVGTANDFHLMAGLPSDLDACAQIISASNTRQIDVGQVNNHFFINNSAIAMEPMVTLENIRMTRLSGEIRYVVALIKAIIKLKAWQMQISWDGGEYKGPTYLLSVCNSPRTGGFNMAPGAELDDGLFDFVFAPEVSKVKVMAILGRLLRGTHIHHPQVTFGRTSQLMITSEPGTPIHADGEIVSESATAVSYQILPGKITLLCE